LEPRHEKNRGKKKLHYLETTDRKLADRRLAEWLSVLTGVDPTNIDMTLDGLLDHFAKVRAERARATRNAESAITKNFKKKFPRPMTTLVSRIRNSDIVQWLAAEKPRLRSTSFNRYRLFARQLFEHAVSDGVATDAQVGSARGRETRENGRVCASRGASPAGDRRLHKQ
jgi:hypothetical protein